MSQSVQPQPVPTAAIGTMYRNYMSRSRRRATRYYPGDPALVEDVVQDVFLRLCEVRDRIDTDRPMGPWVDKVTANRCRSLKRREAVVSAMPPGARDLTAEYSRGRGGALEQTLVAREQLCKARHLLGTVLTARQARFVSMHYLEGVSQRGIAKQYGLSPGYVCKVTKRAVARLRDAVARDSHAETASPESS